MMKPSRNTLILAALALGAGLAPAVTYGQSGPLVIKPRATFASCRKPEWPKESLRKEEQGMVILSFMVDSDGTVKTADVMMSSGHVLLDLAAQNAISRCTFVPGSEDGKVLPMKTELQYIWSLESPASAAQLKAAEAAAENGDARSQHALGVMYVETAGEPARMSDGLRLLRAAAARDYRPAQQKLAALLLTGADGAQGKLEAAGIYRKLAIEGDIDAQYKYGSMLVHGWGIAQDTAAGLDILRKASWKGHWASGSTIAAELLRQSDPEGHSEAFALLDRSYKQGDVNALTQIAYCFETAKGVETNIPGAREIYRTAARAGSLNAKMALARLESAPKQTN